MNDIENPDIDGPDITKVGPDGKFVNFERKNGIDEINFIQNFYYFKSSLQEKEKLSLTERYESVLRLQTCILKRIEEENKEKLNLYYRQYLAKKEKLMKAKCEKSKEYNNFERLLNELQTKLDS
jgi:hypothetical protein